MSFLVGLNHVFNVILSIKFINLWLNHCIIYKEVTKIAVVISKDIHYLAQFIANNVKRVFKWFYECEKPCIDPKKKLKNTSKPHFKPLNITLKNLVNQ